jgi:hypothetical protein
MTIRRSVSVDGTGGKRRRGPLPQRQERGRIRCLEVRCQVYESTRLVALASCHYLSVWRIDLEALAASFIRVTILLLRRYGIQTSPHSHQGRATLDFSPRPQVAARAIGAGILYVGRNCSRDSNRSRRVAQTSARPACLAGYPSILSVPNARRLRSGLRKLARLGRCCGSGVPKLVTDHRD